MWSSQGWLRKRLWALFVFLLTLLAAVMVIGAGVYLARTVAPGWLCLGVAPGVGVLFLIGFFLIRARAKSKPSNVAWALGRPWEVEVLSTGFWLKTDQFREFTPWSALWSVWKTRLTLWITSGEGSSVIPKRAFGSEEDFNNFKASIVQYASAAEPEKQRLP